MANKKFKSTDKTFTIYYDKAAGLRTRKIFLKKMFDGYMRIAPEKLLPEHCGNFEAYEKFMLEKLK